MQDFNLNPVVPMQDRVGKLIETYKSNPEWFDDRQVQELEDLAKQHQIEFTPGGEDFSLLNTASKLATGFVEGFTTISVGDEPRNTYESIAHSLGHLAGFAPGILAAPARWAFGKTAGKIVAKVGEYSLPMIGGNIAKKGFEKGLAKAGWESKKFWQRGSASRGITESALHLGAASAVSSVWKGPDEMIDAGVHGAIAGGAFGGIGNFVRLGHIFKGGNAKQRLHAENTLKATLGASFQGLPTALSGAPIEMIMYQTLLGGFFGYKSRPSHQVEGSKFWHEMRTKPDNVKYAYRPKAHPEWEYYSSKAQDYIIKSSTESAVSKVNYINKDERGMSGSQSRAEVIEMAKRHYNTENPTQEQIDIVYRELAEAYHTNPYEETKEVYEVEVPVEMQSDATDPTLILRRVDGKTKTRADEAQSKLKDRDTTGFIITKDGENIEIHKAITSELGEGTARKRTGERLLDTPVENLESDSYESFLNIYKPKLRVGKNLKTGDPIFVPRVSKPLDVNQVGEILEPVIKPAEWRKLEAKLLDGGQYIFGGVKDKGVLKLRRFHLDTNQFVKETDIFRPTDSFFEIVAGHHKLVAKNKRYLAQQAEGKERANLLKEAREHDALYETDLAIAKQSYKDSVVSHMNWFKSKSGKDKSFISELASKSWVSNALIEAERAGLHTPGSRDYSRIHRLTGDGFSKHVVDWNKREQLYHDKTYKLDDNAFLKNKIYDVKVKMYKHPSIVGKDGKPLDIWHAENLAEAEAQVSSILDGPGKGKNFATEKGQAKFEKVKGEEGHYIWRHHKGDDKHVYIKSEGGVIPEGSTPDAVRFEAYQKGGAYYKGVTEDGKLNYEIYSDLIRDKKGKVIQGLGLSASDADGAVFHVPEVMDAVANNTGIQLTSMHKPVMVAKLPEGGTLAVKAAARTAHGPLLKYMRENDLHTVIMKSSAKHSGEKPLKTLTYDGKKYDSSFWNNKESKFQSEPAYDISELGYDLSRTKTREGEMFPEINIADIIPQSRGKLDANKIRINLGTKEDIRRATEPPKIVKQIFGILNEHQSPGLMKHIFEKYFEPSIAGDKVLNNEIASFAKGTTDKMPSIDLNKIGAEEAFKIVRYRGSNKNMNKLRKQFQEKLFKLDKEGELNNSFGEDVESGFTPEEWINYLQKNTRILDNGLGDGVVDLFKPTRKYAEKVLIKYIMKRHMNPQWNWGGKGWLAPVMPDMPIKEGTFKADRDFNIKVKLEYTDAKGEKVDTKSKLRDLWNLKKAVIDGDKKVVSKVKKKYGDDYAEKFTKEDIEDALEFINIRVPADSHSGVRVLKFTGFSKQKGVSIHTSGLDNSYLGGADKDSDSVFIYHGFDKKVRDAYKKQHYEWQEGKKADGEYIDSKSKELDKIFLGEEYAKNQNKLEDAKKKYEAGDISRHDFELLNAQLNPFHTKFSKFSSGMRKHVAQGASTGLKGIGYGVSGLNKVKSMIDYLVANNGRLTETVEYKGKNGKPYTKEYDITLKPGFSYNKVLRLGREIANRSADAADYPSQIGYDKFLDLLTREAFNIKINGDMETSPQYRTLTQTKLGNIADHVRYADPNPKVYDSSYSSGKAELNFDSFEFGIDRGNPIDTPFKGFASKIIESIAKKSLHRNNKSKLDNLQNVEDAILSISRAEKTIEGFDKSLVRRLTGMFDLKLGAKYVKESKREYLDAEFNYQENPSASNMNTLSKARNKYLDVLSTEVHKLASREALFSKGVDIVRSAEKNGVDSKTVDVILEHARKEAFKVKDTLFNRWEVDGEAFFSEKFAKKRAKGREVIRRKPDPELFDIELQSLKQRMLTSKAKFGKGKQPLKEIIDIKLLEDYIDLIALSPFRKGFAATNTSPFMSRYVHKRNLKDTLNRFNKTYKNILEFAPEAPVEVKANLKDAKVGDYVKTSDKNILIKVLDKVKKSIKLGDNKVDTNNDLKFITKLVEANKGKVVETAKDGTKLHLTGKMRGNEVEVTYKTTDEKPKTTKYYPNYLDLSKLNISPELQQALKYSKTFGSSTDFYFEKVEPKLNKDYSYDFVNQTEKSAVDFIKESLDYSRPDTMVESKADKAEVVLEQLEKTVIDNLPKTKKVEKTRSIYDKDKFQVYKTVMSAKDIIEVKKLEKHIKSNPELAKHFNDWYANFMYDMTKTWKHVDAMTIADVKAMNRYLEDVNSRFKKGGVPLPSNAFRTSPTYLSEEMAQTEHKFFASFERPLQKRDGSIVRQKVRRYTSTLGAMKDWMHLVHNQENAYIESVEPQLEKLFPFRKNLTGEQIWDINKTVIDLRNGKYTTPEQASKVKEYAGEKFTIDGKEYTFVEVVKQVNDAYTKVFKEAGDVWIYAKNSKGEHVKWNKLDNVVYKNSKIKKGTSVNKYLRFKKDGSLDILNFLRNATDPALKGQKLNKIPIENILRFGYEYRLEKIIKKNIKSNGKLDWGKTELSPLEFRAAWRSNSKTKFKGIGKFKAEEYYPRMNFGFNKEARAKMLEFKTQKVKEAYDDAIAKGKSKKEADEIAKMKMLKFEMINEAGKAQGGGVEKQAVEHLMENLDIKGNLKNLENIGLNNRPPNILERTAENMPGYDTTASVVDSYMKTLIRSHYKLLTSAMANYRIDKFEQEGAFGKHTKDWAQHLKFYIRDSLGHPTTFSEDVLDATAVTKNYRDLLKSSLYYKMSDHRVMEAWDKMEAIANGKPVKMGKDMEIVIKAVMPFSKNLPKVTASKGKEYTFTDTPGLYAEQVKARKEYQSRIIHEFGRVEAKYQLLTLLANTGTATANMFGGTGMTVSQGGLKNFMRVHNQGWLQRHLLKNKEGDYHLELNSGKKVKTKKDLYQWVSEQGVIDSFINEEFNLSLEWRNELKRNGKNAKEFMGKATDLIRNNADVKNETLLELARRYNISEGAIKAGGFFMQATERKLRMDAFLTHALKFRENYGTMAKDLPLNDPSVMEAGLKGIEATQFLYHSAFRPAYMRTALGKVMTRFKLFAFESVRARKELYRKAKYYGFEPNTPGFEKFKDLFILDMMTMALGSAFAYSLFDTALPPPYDWLQETGNWLFGDKRERERAFFSQYPYPIAPLQVVTPPIARIPMSAFSTLINGDWDRFADYQMHTLYPFGRIVRQFDKTFNEPYGTTFGRGMQQFFRLPTDKIGKKIRDGVEDIEGHEIIGEQLEGIG